MVNDMNAEIFCYLNPGAQEGDKYPVPFFQGAQETQLMSFSVDENDQYVFVFEVHDNCREDFMQRSVLLRIPNNQFVLHSNELGAFRVRWRSVDVVWAEGLAIMTEWLFQGERIDVIFN
tara:strand:- start:1247 stop:1603 length:357 start_codon:yes stop_codon:yes gene_type:complete